MNEPNKAVQDEELDALRAIFGDDWHDIAPKKTAWGTEGETGWWEVQLHATDDPRVRVKLKGRLTKHYPAQPPPIALLEPVKLTAAHVRTLTKLVQDKAKALVGAPMIFDLTDFVQGWITENHIPLPKPGELEPTLMEEMAQREEAQRAADEVLSQVETEKRKAQEAERFRLLNEKILLDASRKEERNRQAQENEAAKERQEKLQGLADGDLELRELTLPNPISVDGFEGSYASWSLFAGCREALWTSYTAEPAGGGPGFVSSTTPTVTVQVIDFSKPYYQGAHGKKRIDALVSEVTRIMDVRSPHVARVYAVQRSKSPKGWERVIIVVERTSEGGRLSTWLPRDGFGEEMAKEYLIQIMSGLTDLHRAHAMQKQLDADLVLLSPGRDGDVCVKLAGTSYARRITEYHRSNPFLKNQEESFPESWLSPDEIESPYNYSPKRDVWHAGLVLLQMLFGRRCLWTYLDLHTLLQHSPGGISASLMDLLSGLLNPSHKKRLTAEEALSRLRAPDEEITSRPGPRPTSSLAHVSSTSASTPLAEMFGKSPVFGRGLGSFFPPQTPGGAALRYSRYRSDFEEVEFLGKGGFGEVVKARNKLDGRPYAIKKVKLRPEDNESRVLREVNSLSRVSHQHIVRYYSCWLEEVGPPTRSPADDSTEPSLPTSTAVSSDGDDIFAVNFDDFSMSRRDHSRSASFPRIRFADDSEDDDDDDDDEDDDEDMSYESDGTIPDPSASEPRGRSKAISVPSKPSTSYTGTTTDDGTVQRILYIQMEFVEKQTLREAISAGLSEDEAWRLLVQILQALAHMSSLGIVHRDLKPSNILLDANGNVKIADFGLSTTDLGTMEVFTGGLHSSGGDFSDRTSNIGTSLYIAPEVIVSKSYNEKADMYSLGIIFFEMCFAFKTGMERVQTLNALRSSNVPLSFPAAWPAGMMNRQREIISLLLRHDPTMRPQATQLLNGPLVPTIDKEEKFYDNVITEITNPRSEKYTALIDALFESHTNSFNVDNRIDDYTYDNDHDDAHYVWLTVVVRRVVEVFQRHGAVDDYLPLLIPETTLLKAFPERAPVRLLDSNGKFVQLPASNLLAMARSASRRQIERIKRYVVGRQYSELPAGGQPGTHWELCFDIVTPIRDLCAEAELLELMDKVIAECQGAKGASTHVEYEFHVSHETVLATILAATPVQLRPRVLKAFKGPSAGVAFGYARPSLSSIPGLSKTLIQDLEQCSVADEFDVLRRRVEETFTASRVKLRAALDEIATIIQLTRLCGVRRKILFRPSLSKNAEYFRGGFMFECVRRGKQSEVVSFGGRSDSLLEHFKEPATQMQSRKVHGVGMSISADHLTRVVRKYESALSTRLMEKAKVEERSFGFWSPARCDVYVSSTPQVDINDRLTLVSELWRAGIRADLQYDDGRGLQDVIDECLEQNVLYLVIARGHKSAYKVVRTLTGRTSEEEVDADKLVAWLKTGIADQRRIDQAYAEGAQPIVKDRDTVEAPISRIDADIKLVLPPEPLTSRPSKGKPVRKHRHATKTLYYDKAVEFVNSVNSTLPVLGVDLAPELLSQLALDTAWVTDDEAWRGITHSQPTSERSYSELVRKAVLEHSKTQGGNCWLFSVRDARGFLLQLCR